jgi:hypothetical protein
MNSYRVAVSILLLSAWMAAGCQRTPQLGGQKECLTAADALWTAVNVKQSDLLERSAAEIERLYAAGEMPADAYECLARIIATARVGQWSDARVELKRFLRDQRPAARS